MLGLPAVRRGRTGRDPALPLVGQRHRAPARRGHHHDPLRHPLAPRQPPAARLRLELDRPGARSAGDAGHHAHRGHVPLRHAALDRGRHHEPHLRRDAKLVRQDLRRALSPYHLLHAHQRAVHLRDLRRRVGHLVSLPARRPQRRAGDQERQRGGGPLDG